MAEDYYATLGVGRSATSEEIQKAYRELARKYHPDLNPDDKAAKAKFQEVQNAFDVLNDSEKRQMYDRYGPAYESMAGRGGRPGAGPGGWSAGAGGPEVHVNFEDLFGGGGGSPFGEAGGSAGAGSFADLFKQFGQRARGGQSRAVAGANIEHELQVPFATAVLGGEAQITVRRHDGKTESIHVKVPAGIESGKKIRVRGQGEPGRNGGPAGDILIKVLVAPHPHFRRHGKRLEVTLPITLAEALRGGKVDVPTPHGTITLSIPPGSSSGAKLRVKGHGIRTGDGAGDLFAELQIVLPRNLSADDREQMAKIADKYDQKVRSELRW